LMFVDGALPRRPHIIAAASNARIHRKGSRGELYAHKAPDEEIVLPVRLCWVGCCISLRQQEGLWLNAQANALRALIATR